MLVPQEVLYPQGKPDLKIHLGETSFPTLPSNSVETQKLHLFLALKLKFVQE